MIDRTLAIMVANIGSNIQDTSTAMQPIIKRYLNDTYFDFLRRINHDLIDHDYSVTVSTQDTVLPDNFKSPLYVHDATNDRNLIASNMTRVGQQYQSSLGDTGEGTIVFFMTSPVRAQPTAAGTISFVSSSASDTTQTIQVRGISDGVEVSESVTLTGTTPALSTNSYTEILSLSKDGATVGKVTGTVGTVVICIIPPAVTDYSVKIMRMHEIPSSSILIQMPYVIDPQELVNDEDVPLVKGVGDILELGATCRCLKYKRQYGKARQYREDFESANVQYIWSKANDGTRKFLNITPYSRETV